MISSKTENAPLQRVRCMIYTRKSSEEGLEQEFNSLDAQRESCENYIKSRSQEGWVLVPERFDDGGYSGGTLERPALKRLLQAVERQQVDIIVTYKLDRLTRSLLDFTKMVELFDANQVTFVSVTQEFNSTTSMGRLTLNMLLSFAQFEREIIGERIRDKFAAAKRKGKYMGGVPVLGYDVDREKKKLIVNEEEAIWVRNIFARFIELGSTTLLMKELNNKGLKTKLWITKKGVEKGGESWNKSHIYRLINNPIYIGKVSHKGNTYTGEHEAIVDQEMWDQVQSILVTNHRARANKTRNQSPALLKGLLRCGCCDSSMSPTFTRKNGRTYRYYRCVKACKNGGDTCDTGYLAAGVIEDAVMEQLRSVFASPEIISRTWREVGVQRGDMLNRLQSEIHKLEIEKNEATSRASQLLATKQAGVLSKTLAKDLEDTNICLANLEERIGQLRQEYQALHKTTITERDAAKSLASIEPVWEHLFPTEKARLVELLVELVIIHTSGIEVRLRAGGLHTLVNELQ